MFKTRRKIFDIFENNPFGPDLMLRLSMTQATTIGRIHNIILIVKQLNTSSVLKNKYVIQANVRTYAAHTSPREECFPLGSALRPLCF